MINFPGQNSLGFFFSLCAQVKLQFLMDNGLRFWTICLKGKFILAAAERETLVDWYQFVH